MLIFLYDEWSSSDVLEFFHIQESDTHRTELDGYKIVYLGENSLDLDFPRLTEEKDSNTEGIIAELPTSYWEPFKQFLEERSFDTKSVTMGIEDVMIFFIPEVNTDAKAGSYAGYEIAGELKHSGIFDNLLDSSEPEDKAKGTESEEDIEIDLFSKYTFRDKAWWNKYKVMMLSIAGCAAVVAVAFSIIMGNWFLSSKYTDNIGTEVREEVTVSTTVTSAPTQMENFRGEPVEIVFPDWIQPADEAFDILEIDFEELRKKYPNATAWLVIPGVDIEYPVAQCDDNEYYLTHGIDGTLSRAGWVFADYRNTDESPMRNYIIYGHNMADGTIFGKLKRVLNEDWWSNPDNQYIYLVTEYYSAVYQVYTAMQVKSEEIYYYRRDLSSQNIVAFMEEMKSYDLLADHLLYNKPFKADDKIITLSTCADAQGVEKFVVQGVLLYSKQLKTPE